MKQQCLFLSPFFYPEQISTGKYNSFLVGSLLEEDIEIDVISLHPFYPDWVINKSVSPFKSANVFRYGESIKFPNSQILRRIILEISYSYFVIRHLLNNKKKYDIVITVFPPVLFMWIASGFFKRSIKIGIIHDVQGIMADNGKSFIRKISAKVMGSLEKLVYKKCDRLICLSYSMRDAVINKFCVPLEKCEIFYPFVSVPNEFKDAEFDQLSSIFDKNFKHVVYSGALGEKQEPFALFDFFMALSEADSSVKCHIFSRGPIFNELKARSLSNNYSKVLFHDLVDEKDLNALFSRSTIHVIPQSPGTGSGAFPSKLPNILAHGVPVFAICDDKSELDILLKKVKFSDVIHNWNIESMVNKMVEFIDRIDSISHNEIFLENKRNVLNEFDVNRFVDDLNVKT